jgi:hypothetical protein
MTNKLRLHVIIFIKYAPCNSHEAICQTSGLGLLSITIEGNHGNVSNKSSHKIT